MAAAATGTTAPASTQGAQTGGTNDSAQSARNGDKPSPTGAGGPRDPQSGSERRFCYTESRLAEPAGYFVLVPARGLQREAGLAVIPCDQRGRVRVPELPPPPTHQPSGVRR